MGREAPAPHTAAPSPPPAVHAESKAIELPRLRLWRLETRQAKRGKEGKEEETRQAATPLSESSGARVELRAGLSAE